MNANPLLQGALLILLSEWMLVASGIIIRQLSDSLPTEVLVFLRNSLGLLWLLPWIIRRGRRELPTQRLHLHLLRALVGITAMSCLYYSWANLPLAQAALLKQTSPFFVPVIAFFWLGERINAAVRWAILVGFMGVLLILQPGSGALEWAMMAALAGAALGATAKVCIRSMRSTESPQQIVFYFALFGSCLAAVPAWQNWVMPMGTDWLWLLALAAASTLAQLLLSRAYGLAGAGTLGPFTYASIPFAALAGWWIWDEAMGLWTLAGMGLVFMGGMLALKGQSRA
ncbi:DMT family transporter [Marinobacterium weihaiense]|uniref:DMT family transporter n=1 Tax=Marinobacterium weihaiense TaxID=2851016 RepID=A0ABS6M688_9GAMM|nr:DMT family transporter [Marinobacterium weihaiense]MBV0931791.1 DMT family transporter [Marinobacterium weihaiense]